MRLFHVSEESEIQVFKPRLPARSDIDHTVGLVWAIDEERLAGFLTPRDCPRVSYYAGSQTAVTDKIRFFSSSTVSHAIVIESDWFQTMQKTTLYLYEFYTEDFVLQDNTAGYYVAKTTQHPKGRYILSDLFSELIKRNVEIRITDNLWDIADAIKNTTLNWSLCRMKNAKPRL